MPNVKATARCAPRLLKRYRIKARLSQQEVADRLDVSQASVSNMERGKQAPSVDQLDTMAKAFGVSVRRLR